MSDPHSRDAEAAEYVLGTLPADERRAFEADAARDPALAAAVRAWEERLAPLADALPSVEPRPGLRDEITAAIRTRSTPNVVPFALPDRLRRSRNLWRAGAIGASALAASLAALLVTDRPPSPPSGLVAVVNRAGDLPALIVRVDVAGGVVQVRSVAAETPPARSLELWSVAAGEAPRSLGIIGSGTTRVPLPAGRSALAPDVTLAVSVEPTGGSPTGAPTGPVVYSGKLIAETP